MNNNTKLPMQEKIMQPEIKFISTIQEKIIPRRIHLTKSANGETGTATFIFVYPTLFAYFEEDPFKKIYEMNLSIYETMPYLLLETKKSNYHDFKR